MWEQLGAEDRSKERLGGPVGQFSDRNKCTTGPCLLLFCELRHIGTDRMQLSRA